MSAGFGGAPSLGTGIGRAAGFAAPFAQQMQTQNQTVQYLVRAGYAPDMAQLLARNPAALNEVLKQISGARQYQHVTVKDSLGNEIPLAFDPSSRRYYMPNGQEYGAGQGGVPGLPGGLSTMPIQIDPATGRDEQFLETLKKQDPTGYSTVLGLLNGDINAGGRNMQKHLPLAARAESGFNMQQFQTRQRTMNDFTPRGVSGKNITAINTGLGHVERQKNVATYRQDVNAVSGELAKAFRSAGMSEADIQSWRKSFTENSSPETMHAAAREALHLLDSRLNALTDSYNRGMGLSARKEAPDLLSPEARGIHNRLLGAEVAETPQQAAVPPPEARRVGQVYQTPRGRARWLGKGWQPVAQ
jgi:hypothetical protein